MREKKRPISDKYFDIIAMKYDKMNTLLSFGLHHLWRRTAIKMLGLIPGERVIDVCGGTGDLSILAAELVGPYGRVVLCDINREMIVSGRPKAWRRGISSIIDYVQGDAEEIPFCGGRFDSAVVGFGIRNMTRMEKGLEEIYRILRPGGKFVCLEFSMPKSTFFRWLYHLYFSYIIPLAGQLIAGSRESYAYLPASIKRFPLPEEIKDLLNHIGFVKVIYRRLWNGIVVIYIGLKP